MRVLSASLISVVLGLALGCKDETSDAPPPPSSGGAASGAIGVDGGQRPPRDDEDDEDAGPGGSDAGEGDSGILPTECRDVPAVQVPAEELLPGVEASTSSPADFGVTRLLAAWQGGCDAPVFHIELSDGRCPDGRGHALSFMIDAAALRDGSLRIGQNLVMAEPNDIGVRIRYVRPDRRMPAGEWGTCTGATGVIDLFGDEPDTTLRSTLEGTFALELSACDGSGAPLQIVNGTFDVTLRRSLADYCPEL